MRSAPLAFAGILVTILTIAGCGGAAAPAAPVAPAPVATAAATVAPALDMAALEQKAKQEGSLTIYSVISSVAQLNMIKAAFETKYPGITATFLGLSANALNAKFDSEVKTGNVLADIIWVSEHGVLDQNVKELAPLTDLPAWKAIPDKFKTSTYAVASVSIFGIIYNTNKVKPGELTKWSDVIAPKWKGQVTATAVSSCACAAANYSVLSKSFGDDFLRGLAAQQPIFQMGSAPSVALVSSGEKSIGFFVTPRNYVEGKNTGAPLGILTPEPALASEQDYGVLAKAKHPNAARLMLNFLMGRDGQQLLTGNNQGSSVLADIPTSIPLPPTYTYLGDISDAETARVAKILGSP